MTNVILTDIVDERKFDAGTKARNDAIEILKDKGFIPVVLFNRRHNAFIRTIEVMSAILELLRIGKQLGIVVIQYPYKPAIIKMIYLVLKIVSNNGRSKSVLLIHDINYLRTGGKIDSRFRSEIELLNRADSLIVHNHIMRQTLVRDGVQTNMIELELFDYLYSGTPATLAQNSKPQIVFAGNLNDDKSGFLYNGKIDSTVTMNLYGNLSGSLPDDYQYYGSYPPDRLIENVIGDYGLVWDGPCLSSCSGDFGNYLRYNNPHKCSLYLAAGLPVIIWNAAALSKFITEFGCGIAIDSLEDLSMIPQPNSQEYSEMIQNVKRVQARVQNGFYLSRSIDKLLS